MAEIESILVKLQAVGDLERHIIDLYKPQSEVLRILLLFLGNAENRQHNLAP